MAVVRFSKVVASLPPTLTPDTVYMVRTGDGFDLYVSDATASVGHKLNSTAGSVPQVPFPKRSNTPKVIGDVISTASSTMTLTAGRQYFIPFTVPRIVNLLGLRISVTTAASGNALLGIYGNTTIGGNDAPGPLLAGGGAVSTASNGDKNVSFTIQLTPNVLYWASLLVTAAPAIRGIVANSVLPDLGRTENNTTVIGMLFADGVGSTLPNPAPTSLSNWTQSRCCIYMLE